MSTKANVLVVGNSGVGKSTLINAIFGADRALTGSGEAVTTSLEVYDNEGLPFRIIDTIGFEYGFMKQQKAIHAVQKWSKDSINKDEQDKQIHLVWYCVDATSRKMFGKNIEMLIKSMKIWKDAPVIAVLTKSYSTIEVEENKKMIEKAFARYKGKVNLKSIVPVVAEPYRIDEDKVVEVRGIMELVEETNRLIPEGLQLNALAVKEFDVKQKRKNARAITATCTVAGATVGAVPVPFPDAVILTPLELGLVKSIAKVYGISSTSDVGSSVIKTIVEVGTVSVAARSVIVAIKAIPGLNIAGAVLNAVVAGVIIATIGEATAVIMENIYLGKKDAKDLDWVTKFVENELTKTVAGKVQEVASKMVQNGKVDAKDIAKLIIEVFAAGKKGQK
ncbi:MAG: 50S ribosome-binding GTPase [Lachnospiraceae bacterium]|nr:50S ribosome-binding GTPase [Lachnospiraceae bacterium]